MGIVGWVLVAVAAYVVIGIVFAAMFVVWGVGRVDPAAAHASVGFRVLILPGVVALWPLMLAKWRRVGGHS